VFVLQYSTGVLRGLDAAWQPTRHEICHQLLHHHRSGRSHVSFYFGFNLLIIWIKIVVKIGNFIACDLSQNLLHIVSTRWNDLKQGWKYPTTFVFWNLLGSNILFNLEKLPVTCLCNGSVTSVFSILMTVYSNNFPPDKLSTKSHIAICIATWTRKTIATFVSQKYKH